MKADQTPEYLQLEGFVSYPREDMDAEYKDWLNLGLDKDRATLAKAAIALANHGGGHIIIGFQEVEQTLRSVTRPPDLPEISQDAVNAAVRRFAEPEFHCQVYGIPSRAKGTTHAIIRVSGSSVPVMSKRDNNDAGVSQHKFYIRKPGPRSEEPHTAEEWRSLLDRCIRARREYLLDSIRSIVLGQAEAQDLAPEPLQALGDYCTAAYERWTELVSDLPTSSPSRFPHGFYEMGFALEGATPAVSLTELSSRLLIAQAVKLSGWPHFLHMNVQGWEPQIHEDFIEAWVGRPIDGPAWDDPFHADFWRASLDGKLYTIRGYIEDGELAKNRGRVPGTEFSDAVPSIKIAEGLLFARRYADAFEGVEQVAIRCRFTGLEGRSLLLVDHPAPFTDVGPVIHDDEVVLIGQVPLDQIEDNLIEVIYGFVKRLYERFGFYPISINHIRRILLKLTQYG